MKKALLLSTLIMSGSALAHDTNNISFSGDSCNLTIENTVKITPQNIAVIDSRDKKMTISTDGHLTINNKEISLTSAQQHDLAKYSDGLREQLPQIAEIALDGVKIAGIAIDEVSEALGLSSMDAVSKLMDDLAIEIEHEFYQGDTFVIDQKQFDAIGDSIGDKYSDEIEEAMEEAVMNSIGSIFMAIGSELLGSGGDFDEMEKRFENMGERIEKKVEAQAANIEKRANALCETLQQLADQEETLHDSIPGLANYEIFVEEHSAD